MIKVLFLLIFLSVSVDCSAGFNQYKAVSSCFTQATDGFNEYKAHYTTYTITDNSPGFNQYEMHAASFTLPNGGDPFPAAGVVTSGLLHWWKCDEGSGETVSDTPTASTTTLNGTLGGTYVWTKREKEDSSTVSVTSFTSNGYVTCGKDQYTFLSDNDFSVDFWLLMVKNNVYPFSWGAGGGTACQWQVGLSTFNFNWQTAPTATPESIDIATDATWHHYTYTKKHTPSLEVIMYQDGVSNAYSTKSADAYTSYGDFMFGNLIWNTNFGIDGAMGSVKVYNRALTAGEAQQNYDAEK